MSGAVRTGGLVLVDTNVIIEAHRKGTWSVLSRGYQLETMEECVTETNTGFKLRRKEQDIDAGQLHGTLAADHAVSEREVVELDIKVAGTALDLGEKLLWARALARHSNWLLCGPDKASLRCGVRLGFRERLVSLEEILLTVGYRKGISLYENYTKAWLDKSPSMIVVSQF